MSKSELLIVCLYLCFGTFTKLAVGGEERRELPKSKNHYILVLPKDYDVKNKYELIVALHGAGDIVADFCKIQRHFEGRKAIMAFPEGTEELILNPFDPASKNKKPGFCYQIGDLDAIVETVEDVEKNYSVDPARKILFGFSNGCGMGFYCVAKRPNLFTFFGGFGHGKLPSLERQVVSGPRIYDLAPDGVSLKSQWSGLPDERELKAAAAKVPIFFCVGMQDPNYELSKDVVAILKKLKFTLRYEQPNIGHYITEEGYKKMFAFFDECMKANSATSK